MIDDDRPSFRDLIRDRNLPTMRDLFRMLDIAGDDGCIVCAATFDKHHPATHTVTFTTGNTTQACADHIAPELWAPSPDPFPGRVPQGEVSLGEVSIAPIGPEGVPAPTRFSLLRNEHSGELVGVQIHDYPYRGARPAMVLIEDVWEGLKTLEEPPKGWTAEDWKPHLAKMIGKLGDAINAHQAAR